MKRFSHRGLILCIAIAATPIGVLPAQKQADTVMTGARRSMVTRVELQAALEDIQRGLTSTAYSPALRTAKQAEADAIRSRLAPDGGDLRSGDEVKLEVLLEPGLTGTYTVTPDRKLILPGNLEIPLAGVLRSEIQTFLTEKLKKYLTDPSVSASASVRISIFGGVAKPGFYNVPANMLLSAALHEKAGGVANNFRDDKSKIIRDTVVVVDGAEFKDALYRGRTLDQLNIQAGDRIDVALKPSSGLFWRILGGLSAISGVAYLVILLTRN